MITGIIKAFMRPNKLRNCIVSASRAGIERILVGYDGPEELWEEHKKICEELGAEIFKYEFNIGLSYVRNRLTEEVKTKYLFLLDDDVYIPSNSLEMIYFLEKHLDIAGVGMGWIRKFEFKKNMMLGPQVTAHDYIFKDNMVNPYFNFKYKNQEVLGTLLFMWPFDYIPNCAIYRKEVFDEEAWDERFIIDGEHFDYMNRLKENGKWKLAICPSLYAIHDEGGSEVFKKFRSGKMTERTGQELLFEKWNIKETGPNKVYQARYLDWRRELRSMFNCWRRI